MRSEAPKLPRGLRGLTHHLWLANHAPKECTLSGRRTRGIAVARVQRVCEQAWCAPCTSLAGVEGLRVCARAHTHWLRAPDMCRRRLPRRRSLARRHTPWHQPPRAQPIGACVRRRSPAVRGHRLPLARRLRPQHTARAGHYGAATMHRVQLPHQPPPQLW